MCKRTISLFFKYFWDLFLIMLSFIIIIGILFSCFIYNYASTNKNLYRTQATEQTNLLIADMLDDCTSIFASLSSNQDILAFENLDVNTLSEIQLYNLISRMQSTLSDKITSTDYISSIYICSQKNNYVLSPKNLKKTSDFSNYIIYNENLLNNDNSLHKTTSIASDADSNTAYIILNKTLDIANPESSICIIILNASILKNNISKTLYDSDCSFLIWDNLNNIPIINLGLDNNLLSEIHKSSVRNKKPSFFNRNQYNKLYTPNDYNWDCIYVYDNTSLNKEILQNICLIIPLSFIILILIAILLSYIRAKKAYLPINKIVDTLTRQKDNVNMQDFVSNYSYTEINYIIETLMNNIKDKNELQEALEKKFQQLNDANRYALEVQIQPHFIFNTLEIVYLESYELFGDKNIISEIIYNLSDILRLTLRNDNKLIPICSELDFIKKYLYIQNIRFEDLFETTYDIDKDIDNLLTPKLILQPIVENSIKHGIIPAEKKCNIKISNYIEDERVVFIIEDTGIGMNPKRLQEIREIINDESSLPSKNIGIANVNMRIKLIFGNDFGCEIISSDSNGTKIKISIPIITP